MKKTASRIGTVAGRLLFVGALVSSICLSSCKSTPKELFELVRTEEIAELDSKLDVERLKLIATDGSTNYIRDKIDEMDEYTFGKWTEYHLATCERQDIIGISDHTLDILRKKQK